MNKKRKSKKEESILLKYLKDANKVSKLSSNEEEMLLKQYYNSTDEVEKSKIRNRIVESHQLFVYSIAKMYSGNDEDLTMDLIIEGNLGMYETFDNYDLNKNSKFLTYAVFYIKRKILRFIESENLMVRPSNNSKLKPKIKRIEEEFYKKNGRKPNIDEIEEELFEKHSIKLKNSGDINGVTIERIESDNTMDSSDDFDSLKDFNLHTYVNNDFEIQSEKDYMEKTVKLLLSKLPKREENIIKMAYGINSGMEPCNNEEIAEQMNMTSERIRQLKKQAESKIKNMLKRIEY